MITYDWNCRTVDIYPQEGEYNDVVYNVHWRVTGTSDEVNSNGDAYVSSQIGTQNISVSDILDFMPFEDLTNEICVSWTQTAMGYDQVSSIEYSIDQSLQSLITPTSRTVTIN